MSTLQEESLTEAACANGDCRSDQLVLADWWEDQGDDVISSFWRWVSHAVREPDIFGETEEGHVEYQWSSEAALGPHDRKSMITPLQINNLPKKSDDGYEWTNYRYYTSRRRAYETLLTAWVLCSPQERESLHERKNDG